MRAPAMALHPPTMASLGLEPQEELIPSIWGWCPPSLEVGCHMIIANSQPKSLSSPASPPYPGLDQPPANPGLQNGRLYQEPALSGSA